MNNKWGWLAENSNILTCDARSIRYIDDIKEEGICFHSSSFTFDSFHNLLLLLSPPFILHPFSLLLFVFLSYSSLLPIPFVFNFPFSFYSFNSPLFPPSYSLFSLPFFCFILSSSYSCLLSFLFSFFYFLHSFYSYFFHFLLFILSPFPSYFSVSSPTQPRPQALKMLRHFLPLPFR
jgi:hypothetical protein